MTTTVAAPGPDHEENRLAAAFYELASAADACGDPLLARVVRRVQALHALDLTAKAEAALSPLTDKAAAILTALGPGEPKRRGGRRRKSGLPAPVLPLGSPRREPSNG